MPLPSAYFHVLLNPIPVYGLAMGVAAMFLALALRSRPARIVALSLIFFSSLVAWPVFYFGEKACDDVTMIADDDGSKWLDEHRRRAETSIVCFYLVAGVSLAALLVPRKWPASETPLTATALLLALGTLGVGGWIAFAGGHIRHPEFRSDTAPPAEKTAGH